MSVSTEQLIFELHISRTDKGVYMWTTIYGGGEMFGESDEPENSIEGCLLAASKEMPENAIASVRYRGIPIRAYRAAVLTTEAATAAKAIVALYADLVDPM